MDFLKRENLLLAELKILLKGGGREVGYHDSRYGNDKRKDPPQHRVWVHVSIADCEEGDHAEPAPVSKRSEIDEGVVVLQDSNDVTAGQDEHP